MAEASRGSCEGPAPDRPELPNAMSKSVTLAAGDAAGKSFLRSCHSRDLVRRGNLPVAVAEQDDQEGSAALDLGEADLEHLDLTGGFVGFESRRSRQISKDLPAALFQLWERPGCNCAARVADFHPHHAADTFASKRALDDVAGKIIAILGHQAAQDRCARPLIVRQKAQLDASRLEIYRIIETATARSIHIALCSEAPRDLENSILCAQRRRHLQRTRTNHVPRQSEIASDVAKEMLDIVDRTSLGVSQRGHDVRNPVSIPRRKPKRAQALLEEHRSVLHKPEISD